MNSNIVTAFLVVFGLGSILWALADIASVSADGLECVGRSLEADHAR